MQKLFITHSLVLALLLAAAEYARFLKADYDQAKAIFAELGLARKNF